MPEAADGFWKPQSEHEQAPPGETGSYARIQNISVHLQLRQTGDGTGDTPGRYRPVWCRNVNSTSSLLNPNLGFAELAPRGQDKVLSPRYESLRTSTTTTNRGRKRCPPKSIQPRTVWNPQRTSCLLNPSLGS